MKRTIFVFAATLALQSAHAEGMRNTTMPPAPASKPQEQASEQQQPSHKNALECICHGGPGGYTYRCPPQRKTCYGGPGNYAYECTVCPEGN